MIAWADCITVTIARPRATASPPILIYICAPFRRERHGVGWLGPKVPVRHRSQLLSNVGSKFRAWARNNPATFRGTTFGRGTGHLRGVRRGQVGSSEASGAYRARSVLVMWCRDLC